MGVYHIRTNLIPVFSVQKKNLEKGLVSLLLTQKYTQNSVKSKSIKLKGY